MNWTDYYMGFAEHAAKKSKDPNTQVGCVIVGPDGEIRSSGYNGAPRGVDDLPERLSRPGKKIWVSHAEENSVAHAARVGVSLKGCVAWVTHRPCARCARMLIQAGIKEVHFGDGKLGMVTIEPEEFEAAITMFKEAGIDVHTPEMVRIGRLINDKEYSV